MRAYQDNRGALHNDDVSGSVIPYNFEPPKYARRDPSNIKNVHKAEVRQDKLILNKFAGAEPPVHRFAHRFNHPIGSDVIAGAGN